MKLVNKTKWRTDDLKTIVKRVIGQIEQYGFDAACRKRLILTIVPARQQYGCSGNAYVNGRRASVRIPTKADSLSDKIKIDFAHMVAHECAHIMGHKGERWMRAHPVWGRKGSNIHWAWAAELPLRKQEKKPIGKSGGKLSADAKIAALDLRLKKWTSKLIRAQRAIRKLVHSRKYYEKLLSIAAQNTTSQS